MEQHACTPLSGKVLALALLAGVSLCSPVSKAAPGLAATPFEDVMAEPSSSPSKADDKMADYVISGAQQRGQWLLMFGPRHDQSHQAMKLTIPLRNGALGFSCNSKGDEDMSFMMAGVEVDEGTTLPVPVVIGGASRFIHAVARSEKKGAVETIFEAKGDDAEGVLAAISQLPDVQGTGFITVTLHDRKLDIPVPHPLGLAVTASDLCLKWHNGAALRADGRSVPALSASTEAGEGGIRSSALHHTSHTGG